MSVKYVCDICGKELPREHWIGGYIDHYTNFASWHKELSADPKRIAEKIAFHGNSVRNIYDIEERLACLITWPELGDDEKAKIEKEINSFIEERKRLETESRKIASAFANEHCDDEDLLLFLRYAVEREIKARTQSLGEDNLYDRWARRYFRKNNIGGN